MIEPELKRDLILSVGTHKGKRPLSPVEVAEGFEKAQRGGMTEQELADLVQLRYPTMIGRFKRLLRLSPDLRHLVDWGSSGSTISFTAASEVARLNSSDHGPVLNAVLENGLNKNEVTHADRPDQESVKQGYFRMHKTFFPGNLTHRFHSAIAEHLLPFDGFVDYVFLFFWYLCCFCFCLFCL